MDSDCKQDRESQSSEILEKSFASPGVMFVQESEVNAVLPALGSDNSEVGTYASTQVMREVLKKVFDTSLERNRELVQGRCVDCGKKKDCSPLRLEPQSTKRIRTQLTCVGLDGPFKLLCGVHGWMHLNSSYMVCMVVGEAFGWMGTLVFYSWAWHARGLGVMF
ncbi:hypothetical protein J1N35_022744 [Gossypium stocksii]|uniref:Uncharacterized protein n=1 Tax=Gossypium stocksii TaxID=47602 RepID=A0A9D3VHB4_9ROSI|nr:hypothetical protein J1N35_022744 [Gossypium stocksii]